MNTNEQEASQSKEPELIKKVPGGWWTIGIGLATVLIGGLTLNQMYKNNAGNTSIGSGIPDTTSGGAYDTGNQVAGAMDSQLSGLLSQEQINQSILQQILAGMPVKSPTPSQSLPPTGIQFIGRPIYSGTIPQWQLTPLNKGVTQPTYRAGTGRVQYGK